MARVTGGNKLAVVLASINTQLHKGELLRVGFLENATYPDGTRVAMVAAIQEFGAPRAGIPPRPFFRNMIAQHRREWPRIAADLLRQNNYDAKVVLRLMGEGISGQLRQSIVDTMTPPLSPVTLMLRKMKSQQPGLRVNRSIVAEARRRVARGESTAGVSIKPLVETGHLLNSIDYEVN